MKNLGNCKPREFLKQTYRIKKSFEKWIKDTAIADIRADIPKLKEIPKDATEEEKAGIERENKTLVRNKAFENFSRILDAVMEEHADETLELMALCCFVEPENVDDYPMSEYLGAIGEMLDSPGVRDFFTSLVRLVNRLSPGASRV